MYAYRARYLKTIDGDTIDVIADLGFNISMKIRLRLSDVDTPERGQAGWSEATQFTKEWCEANPDMLIFTEKDKSGGFGRYLATVCPWSEQDADYLESLNQRLLDSGHAVLYRP